MSRPSPDRPATGAVEPVFPPSISVIDSHTEGEPTRVVVAGWPQPAGRTMAERREDLRARYDHLRAAVVREPRGHEAIVGALLTPPVEPGSVAGVVFFNNVGYLGTCGHGLIGVVRTLAYLRRVPAAEGGEVRIDTPVGTAGAVVELDGAVTIRNVPVYCYARDMVVDVPGLGAVVGDIAWGGNWFFLTQLPGIRVAMDNLAELSSVTRAILATLRDRRITGANDQEIDHVELTAPPGRPDANSRNYVLCPGGEYDRSPCGTGTSAKMAALHARGELRPGQRWRQESVTGSLFTGWLTQDAGGALVPHIRGRAWITGEATLHFEPGDPFRGGLDA